MASNTLIFSNYSRGIELLFGDLVFNSDSGVEILKNYKSFSKTELEEIKLMGVRNVFSQHTYEHRFHHIISKISLQKPPRINRRVLVVSIVENADEANRIVSFFEIQEYVRLFAITFQNGGFLILFLMMKILKY